MTYRPHKKTAEMLNWTLNKVKSVPYSVTLRWAFYRCVQELGLGKKQYNSFKEITAKARKEFWNGWKPWTLVDDTRKIYGGGDGFENFNAWIESFKDYVPQYEIYSGQNELVMIWFEAQAMYSQFEHYCQPYRIPFTPFKGDPSIYLKWGISKQLAELCLRYEKPIRILYFGDYEPFEDRGSRGKGLSIPLDALKDIRPWFVALIARVGYDKNVVTHGKSKPLEFERVGLNREHIEEFGLPENPTRPGEYQWEALADAQAEELIVGSIKKYWNTEHVEKIEEREAEDGERWNDIVDKVLEEVE